MANTIKEDLGIFTNHSGGFMVSDPCYEKGTWCQSFVENVATGNWHAFVIKQDGGRMWGIMCAELVTIHDSVEDGNKLDWGVHSQSIGVDSGQAGIFELETFRKDDSYADVDTPKSQYGDSVFYNLCCDLTISEMNAGTLKDGVVSASGYGDGCYDCYTTKNSAGDVIGTKIVFLYPDEDDKDI